eukprot:1984-Heterococcus_DN1.PRE.1
MPCSIWADCSCDTAGGEPFTEPLQDLCFSSCNCGGACKCGTVTQKALADLKATACKFGDCPCGTDCGCGGDCACGGTVPRTDEQWLELAKKAAVPKTGECPWADCKCKQGGGECACKESCSCGSTKA